ncbi:TerB family tellurite resistance protein [Nereida sp. MMG025]|uniref:tellurite resistance TerB family protein n=1 Tax=Nereida sp. MMG025 TaxID=2909981 RepID=UPI001F2B6AA4|nr:TerB family tellurite resistance protein [Nereida sp. MMG025]MCF6443834.1 TerB family tellurite resistance protein [Nereida sp. MMG025]
MFADFLSRLSAPKPEPLSQTDARLALTALLVRVARSDGDYAASEQDRITAIITKRYGLSGPDAQDLKLRAETLESEAPDTVRFTDAIKNAIAYEDRVAVIEALWSVAMADDQRDDEEVALLRMVAKFLGVSDMDSNLARQRATDD